MGYRRHSKKSTIDELFDMLFDMTSYFWQVGAVVTILLLVFSYMAYEWVENLNSVGQSSRNLNILIESYGWALYSLPLVIVILAFIFGLKSYNTYQNNRFINY